MRVKALAEDQIVRSDLLDAPCLAFGFVAAEYARRRSTAPARQVRQRCQCRLGAAKTLEQLAEGDRTDPGASRKPDSIDEILAQLVPFPNFGSVPALSRAKLTRCFHSTRAAKPSRSGK